MAKLAQIVAPGSACSRRTPPAPAKAAMDISRESPALSKVTSTFAIPVWCITDPWIYLGGFEADWERSRESPLNSKVKFT